MKNMLNTEINHKSMIIKRAWGIAKDSVKKEGGKVTQYLSISLKKAWAETETTETAETETTTEKKSLNTLLTKFKETIENSYDYETEKGVFRPPKILFDI